MGNEQSSSSQSSHPYPPSHSTTQDETQDRSPYGIEQSSFEPQVTRRYPYGSPYPRVTGGNEYSSVYRGYSVPSSSSSYNGRHDQSPCSSGTSSVRTPTSLSGKDVTLRQPPIRTYPQTSISRAPAPSRDPAVVSEQRGRASKFSQDADQANEQPSSTAQPTMSRDKLISNWEDELTCPICSDIYSNPLTLNCGHSFCKECLAGWAVIQSPRDGRLRTFSCPLCKTTYTSSSLETMQVNITLRNLCSEYKQQVEQSKTIATKGKVVADGLGVVKEKDYCKEHPTEEAKFVCLSCFVLFCGRCSVLSKMHVGDDHNVKEKRDAADALRAVFEEYKKQSDELQVQASEASQTLQCELHDLMSLEDEVNQQTEDLKKKVSTEVDKHTAKCRQKVETFSKDHFDTLLERNEQVDLKMMEIILNVERELRSGPIVNKLKSLANFIVESDKLEEEFKEVFDRLENLQKVKLQLQVHSFDDASLASIFDKNLFFSEHKVSKGVMRGCKVSEIDGVERKILPVPDGVRKKSSCSSLERESKSKALAKPEHKKSGSKSSLGCTPICTTRGQSVKPVVLSQFAEAKNYDLGAASWIFEFVVVLNMKRNDICAINVNTGKLVCMIRRDQLPFEPCGVSAKLKGDTIILFITGKSIAETYSNVLMYKGPKENLTGQLPLWENCNVLSRYTLSKVRVFAHILCGITSNNGIIKIGDINGPAWNDKHHYPGLVCAEDIAIGNSSKGYVLFVKGGGNVVQSKNVYGKGQITNFDTTSITGVSCLAPDKKGNLWIVDEAGLTFSSFSDEGYLINQYNSPEKICSVHFTNSWMMLLTQNNEKGIFMKIPLKSLGQ